MLEFVPAVLPALFDPVLPTTPGLAVLPLVPNDEALFPPNVFFLVPIEETKKLFPARVLGGPISVEPTAPDLVDETCVRDVPNVGIGERICLTFGGFNET